MQSRVQANQTSNGDAMAIFNGRFTADTRTLCKPISATYGEKVHHTTMAKRTADNAAIAKALVSTIDDVAKASHYVGGNEFTAACIADFKAAHCGLNAHEVMMAEYAGFAYQYHLREVERIESLNAIKDIAAKGGDALAALVAQLAAQMGMTLVPSVAEKVAVKAK